MRLINIKTLKNAIIYGALDNKCFTIKVTPYEFDELKKTDVPVEYISVYDSFISITCGVNTERAQDLILKAQDMCIQVKYFA